MNEFQLSLSTVIEADETLLPVEHACRVLRRDLRDAVSGRGENNFIRVLMESGIGEEQYRAEVTGKEIILRCGDALGAVYALLSVSERCLGVKPLGWWHGLRPEKTERRRIPCQTWESPSYVVRFRCWFINDEVLLDGWKDTPADRREVWRRLFETLLRCGGNMVIPGTDRGPDGEALRQMALDMGLWLGQEHTELLGARMFSRVWPDLTPSYRLYPQKYEMLWREAAEKYAKKKLIWSIGFRGQGDHSFWEQDPEYDTDEKRGAFISRVMKRQMEIVRAAQPDARFMTYLYGEMMALYRRGLLEIPPETALIWGDNGYGRMVSRRQNRSNPRTDAMPCRSSGHPQGIYYHIGFYDLQAANHLTMLQISPHAVAKELESVLEHGAGMLWNINTGSFKPHLYFVDLVSRLWREGSCDVTLFSEEYAKRYYGCERASVLLEEYARHAVAYGPHEDDRAGDQFYHFALRAAAHAAVRGQNRPVESLRWAAEEMSFRRQVLRLAHIVKPGIENWKQFVKHCGETMDSLREPERTALADSLLLQGIIHRSGCEMLYSFCQAAAQGDLGNDLQAFLWTHSALRAAREGLDALRQAEHGEFRNFYRNDCFTNMAQSARTLESMRSFYRLRGDGEMQYDWEKMYLVRPEEKLVVLQTHRWNQLTEEELGEALRGMVNLEEVE